MKQSGLITILKNNPFLILTLYEIIQLFCTFLYKIPLFIIFFIYIRRYIIYFNRLRRLLVVCKHTMSLYKIIQFILTICLKKDIKRSIRECQWLQPTNIGLQAMI